MNGKSVSLKGQNFEKIVTQLKAYCGPEWQAMAPALALTREFALVLEPVIWLGTALFFIPQSHFSTIICSEQKPFKYVSALTLTEQFSSLTE